MWRLLLCAALAAATDVSFEPGPGLTRNADGSYSRELTPEYLEKAGENDSAPARPKTSFSLSDLTEEEAEKHRDKIFPMDQRRDCRWIVTDNDWSGTWLGGPYVKRIARAKGRRTWTSSQTQSRHLRNLRDRHNPVILLLPGTRDRALLLAVTRLTSPGRISRTTASPRRIRSRRADTQTWMHLRNLNPA